MYAIYPHRIRIHLISTFSTVQSCQRQSDRCQVSRRSCQLVELINSSMHVTVSNGASSPRRFACVLSAPGEHAQLASALQCLVLRLGVCLQSLLLMWARTVAHVAPVAHELGDDCLRQVVLQLASPCRSAMRRARAMLTRCLKTTSTSLVDWCVRR
jgi:hypothetical protein